MAATPVVLPLEESLAQGIGQVLPMAKLARNCIILMVSTQSFQEGGGWICGVAAGGWAGSLAEESCSQGPHCHGNIPNDTDPGSFLTS